MANPDASDSGAKADAKPVGTGVGLRWFFLLLAVMAAVRIETGLVSIPVGALPAVNTLLIVLFVSVPILAVFCGADAKWSPARAGAFIAAGVAAQIAFTFLAKATLGPISLTANAVAQAGLLTWCLGLGALLGSGLRDKNLLIPVSIFGAGYDIYLVLTPAGITNNILKEAPAVFTSMAAQVPAVTQHPTTGRAVVGTFIGPADIVFLTALFVVVFRFRMNPKLTLTLVAPALVLYMLAVLLFDISLPALLPIGACVLAANWRYFRLTKDEWMATGFVALAMAGLIGWSLSRRPPETEPQAVPSPSASAPTPQESAETPGPVSAGQPGSQRPTAPGSTQGPP